MVAQCDSFINGSSVMVVMKVMQAYFAFLEPDIRVYRFLIKQ